jgi:hypothetical protein
VEVEEEEEEETEAGEDTEEEDDEEDEDEDKDEDEDDEALFEAVVVVESLGVGESNVTMPTRMSSYTHVRRIS